MMLALLRVVMMKKGNTSGIWFLEVMALRLASEEVKERVKLRMIPKLLPEQLGFKVKMFLEAQEPGTGGFGEEWGSKQ